MLPHVIVIGGGLAGLTSAILLNRQGFKVTLVEKKRYPFHRVCGEYISNEVKPFLLQTKLFPEGATSIYDLQVSSPSGQLLHQPLDSGGFGISRFLYDSYLSQIAVQEGVEVREGTSVETVSFRHEGFEIGLKGGETLYASWAIGAYGKRALLDRFLQRSFMESRSPYMGVKYHIRYDFPDNRIALHNFQGGYCGISKVENNRYNLCYLTERKALKQHGSIEAMEQAVLQRNPYLCDIFNNADFLFAKPEVINEISFAPKKCIENHMLMVGDTSGLITPLCGNGMAMAMHGAVLLSRILVKFGKDSSSHNRLLVERHYQTVWNQTFRLRLRVGRTLQRLFGDERLTNVAISTLKHTPKLTNWLIRQTHGQPFEALPGEIP